MSEPVKAPLLAATPEVRTPEAKASAPSQRARILAATLGALLLFVGAWLLWVFIEDPSGELPWLPGTWKGAPLILGACFGGVYGALLLILRRFTLRGMLLCSVLSAALAGGLSAYVQTITGTQTFRGSVRVHREYQAEVQRNAVAGITQSRTVNFLGALREAGKIGSAQDFQSMTLALFPNPSENCIDYRLSFEYLAFVQPHASEVRTTADKYVKANLNLYCLAARRDEWDRNDYAPDVLYLQMQESAVHNASEVVRLIVMEPDLPGEDTTKEKAYLIPQTSDSSFDPLFGLHRGEKLTQDDILFLNLSSRIHWLEQHEEDPVIRDCIRDYTKAVLRYLQSVATE